MTRRQELAKGYQQFAAIAHARSRRHMERAGSSDPELVFISITSAREKQEEAWIYALTARMLLEVDDWDFYERIRELHAFVHKHVQECQSCGERYIFRDYDPGVCPLCLKIKKEGRDAEMLVEET